MQNKYLFLDETKNEEIRKLIKDSGIRGKGISFSSSTIEKTGVWIITFSTTGNSKQDAINLSRFDAEVMRFQPIVLENGASAYFNKKIYPLVNDFERLLREFLYLLVTQKQDDKEFINKVKDLEKKTFGNIYTDLFVDTEYMGRVKDLLTQSPSWRISKAEMYARLNQMEELTPWMKLAKSDDLLFIQGNFFRLKSYRNDVMHAHNINYDEYEEIVSLYTKCNGILLNEIRIIYGNKEIKDVYIAGLSEVLDDWINAVFSNETIQTNFDEIGKALIELGKQASYLGNKNKE